MEKLFFKKGLKGDLIFLGQGDKQVFFSRKNSQEFFYRNIFLDEKNGLPGVLATIVDLPNIAWVQNNLDNFGHNSVPSY